MADLVKNIKDIKNPIVATNQQTPAEKVLAIQATYLYDLSRMDMIKFIITALVFVAGMAWNNYITSLIEYEFPGIKHGLLPKLIYAVGISLFSIVLITFAFRGTYNPQVPGLDDGSATAA